MTTVTALAGLLVRLCLAAPPQIAAGPQGDVHIEGDVTYQPGTGRLLVENGAVIRRGDVVVRAPTASYDPATGEVGATGGVLLTDATRVVFADALRAVLGGEWEAEGVVAFVKEKPGDLSVVRSVDEARSAGRNRASFSGTSLHGDRTGRFQLEGARLTLCDCPNGGAPSWEVTARKADIVAGKSATLSWPVLRVTPRFFLVDRPIPILVLPWLYLPLGERQTGFLVPEVRSTGATGFMLAEPLFVTLGRSWDLTLTPEYAFGIARSDVEKGLPAVRGPGAALEVRWTPAVGTEGRAELGWFHDLDREPGGAGGDRFALAGLHAQRLGERTDLQARLRLTSDPVWIRDFTEDYNGQRVLYRRSDLLLSSRRGEDVVLEAGVSYLQPFCPYGPSAAVDAFGPCEGYGTLGAGLDRASRFAALSATIVPIGAGPFRLSARAGAARFAPVSADFDRTATLEHPARPSAVRGDAEAELSLPLVLGRALSFSPWLRGAAAGYAFDAGTIAESSDPLAPARPLDPAASAWAVGGAVLATEVSRDFGVLRHVIAPRVEWRAGTDVAGDALTWLAYDQVDRTGGGRLASGPAGTWQQLRGAVETRLTRRGADVARLEVGQDLDLKTGRFAETFASFGLSAGRFGLDAGARFLAIDDRPEPATPPEPPSAFLDRFTELHASVSLADRRGDLLRAGYFSIGPGGSGLLGAGADPLFDLRPVALQSATGANLSARVAAGGGATLGYDASFPGRATPDVVCPGGATHAVSAWSPTQQTGRFEWDSPCRCFKFAARLGVDQCGLVSYGVTLDLSRVASGARVVP